MSKGQLSWGPIILGGNCPGCNYLGEILLDGNCMGAIGRGLIIWGDIVRGSFVLGGNYPGCSCPGGNCLGGNCAGENVQVGLSCSHLLQLLISVAFKFLTISFARATFISKFSPHYG